MAIEYAEDSGTQPEPGMDEGETVDIPTSMLGGKTVSPGDVVRLEVVSVNEDSGTVTAKYATPKAPEASGGIAEAVKKFEE